MIQAIRKRMNQKGFTLVELMVVIAILGVLAAIAIPRFNESTAKANTARVQADLRTIDSASVQYQADNGKMPATITDLQNYLTTEVSKLKSPKGGLYLKANSTTTLDAETADGVNTTTGRGTLTVGGTAKVAEDFGYVASSGT